MVFLALEQQLNLETLETFRVSVLLKELTEGVHDIMVGKFIRFT